MSKLFTQTPLFATINSRHPVLLFGAQRGIFKLNLLTKATRFATILLPHLTLSPREHREAFKLLTKCNERDKLLMFSTSLGLRSREVFCTQQGAV